MKRFLLITLSTFIALITWAGIIGDANNDGNVDVADITTIASQILGNTPETFIFENADVDGDKAITVSDITGTAAIILGEPQIDDNTVLVTYNDATAKVQVANNIKDKITFTVTGADVSILADASLDKEVNYILSGTTTDGMFQMDGDYKCTITLNGVSITNNDSAAVQIDCGKRIAIVVADGTKNEFIDGKGNQKACFFVDGHAEFEGAGVLSITGNSKHAYSSNEYTQFKKKFTGAIGIKQAVSDGIHVKQYFQINNGIFIMNRISGDCIQVEGEEASEEKDNGNFIMKGGNILLYANGTACDGIKADSLVTIADASLTIYNEGGAEWDEDKQKVSGAAGISGTAFEITNSTLDIFAYGAGGKGISVDRDATFNSSKVHVETYGEVYEENGDDTKPQCIKADSSIYVNGGNDTRIECFSVYGKGFSFDDEGTGKFEVNGNVVAVGEKKSEPTGGTASAFTYTKQKIEGGKEYEYNGLSFTAPSKYNHSSAKVLITVVE